MDGQIGDCFWMYPPTRCPLGVNITWLLCTSAPLPGATPPYLCSPLVWTQREMMIWNGPTCIIWAQLNISAHVTDQRLILAHTHTHTHRHTHHRQTHTHHTHHTHKQTHRHAQFTHVFPDDLGAQIGVRAPVRALISVLLFWGGLLCIQLEGLFLVCV